MFLKLNVIPVKKSSLCESAECKIGDRFFGFTNGCASKAGYSEYDGCRAHLDNRLPVTLTLLEACFAAQNMMVVLRKTMGFIAHILEQPKRKGMAAELYRF